MELQNPTPFQQFWPPTPIYLVHRTQWYKYFHYRKWRCDETVDLMGAHTSLEGAHIAVVTDFKEKAELSRTRWLPDVWREQKEKQIDEWPPGEQFIHINQFMTQKKLEGKEVDIGWTYLVTSTNLSHFEKKRKIPEVAADARNSDERMAKKPEITADEKILVVKNHDGSFNKENNCPSRLKLEVKNGFERAIARCSRCPRERRSLGYYCQQ